MATALDGRVVAFHRTYLATDDDGKAPVAPARKLTRTARGATVGAAIHLAETGETLALAEGIETRRPAARRLGAWRDGDGRATHSTAPAGSGLL